MNPAEAPPDRPKSDFADTLAILRRRAWLIIVCAVIVTLVAVGLSLLQEKQYSASASLLFRNTGSAENLFGNDGGTTPVIDPAREAATNEKLVGLQVVARRTARHLGGLNAEEVSGMVSVSGSGEAEIVSVTATSSDPKQAALVANTFAKQFIAFRAEAEESKLLEAKNLAEEEFERLSPEQQEGPRGEALSSGAEKLGILASLQTGNAELVQPAEAPKSPSSPKPLKNGIVGLIIGLVLGIGLALLFNRLDRRLRDAEEVRDEFSLPILATVPESKAISRSNAKRGPVDLPFAADEAFRMLRAQLRYFNVDRELRTVVVTSHAAGVGKSTVAWNLARVAASSTKAIVIETDLREPTLARQHGLRPGPGLAEVLTHQVELDSAIQPKSLISEAGSSRISGQEVDVIVSGFHPPNPVELLESETMRQVLAQLRGRYGLVVVDTAPIGIVSDAFPLLRACDGVIVVARVGQTTRDSAHEIREQLDRLQVPVLGVVANGVKLRHGGNYGYGQYGRPAGDDAPLNGAAGSPKARRGKRPDATGSTENAAVVGVGTRGAGSASPPSDQTDSR
jgi:capsular exopolysaccharide synthesis family protein